MANRLEIAVSQFHTLQKSVAKVLKHKPDKISTGKHRNLLPYDKSPDYRIAEWVIKKGSNDSYGTDFLDKNHIQGLSLQAIGRQSQYLILEKGDRNVVLPHEAFCYVHGLILANCQPQTYT